MILKVERLWGKDPGWLATLPLAMQGRLLADYRVECDPEGEHWAGRTKRASGSWSKTGR